MHFSAIGRYIIALDLEELADQDIWCEEAVQTANLFHAYTEVENNKAHLIKNKQVDTNAEDYRKSTLKVTPIDITLNRKTMKPETSVPLKAKYLGYGVVRLYKEYEDPKVQDEKTVEVESNDTTVAIVAIPTYFSPTDLIGFIGESVIKDVSHIRMINSENPNRFMVLMKFRSSETARSFQDEFNGTNFNSMESEVCHVIFVKSVIFKPLNLPKIQSGGVPYLMEDPFTLQVKKSTTSTDSRSGKIVKELPTCPVCLERMDSDISGLLTISCQHTFHCNCLSKWRDDSCPVCRYSNLAVDSVKQNEDQCCSACGGTQNLWICLICGNIGCGRYDLKHAIEHYESTNHCFAMDLTTQRVWDYAGDNYVHRLLQNESDGKLVELPSGGSCSASTHSKDKSLENTLEYTDVLLSQLESQREYYESRLAEAADISNMYLKEKEDGNARMAELEESFSKIELNFNKISQKMQQLDKVDQLKNLAHAFENKWKEEKVLSEGLLQNLEKLQEDNKVLGEAKQELEEQVKDLMFFLESQEKFKNASDDVRNGTIVVTQDARERRRIKKGNK